MANQHAAEQESLSSAMSKTELFFENNAKMLSWVLLGLVVLAGLIFGYRSLIVAPRADKAVEMLAAAQARFEGENPDFKAALEGDANGAGFLDVAQKYGSTPAGNLAKHYAGVCYLRLGELENAEKYLSNYSPVKGIPGSIINAQNYGLQGDVAVEQGNYDRAVKLFEKAVKASDNDLTAPIFLRKAGLAEMAKGDNAKAAALFQRVLDEYPASSTAREAEKLLGTTK